MDASTHLAVRCCGCHYEAVAGARVLGRRQVVDDIGRVGGRRSASVKVFELRAAQPVAKEEGGEELGIMG